MPYTLKMYKNLNHVYQEKGNSFMENDLLTEEDLACRWKAEVETIRQWRWNGKGPPFFKQGRQVFYRPEDIRNYEAQKSRKSTAARDIEEEPPALYKIKHSQINRRFKCLNKHEKHL